MLVSAQCSHSHPVDLIQWVGEGTPRHEEDWSVQRHKGAQKHDHIRASVRAYPQARHNIRIACAIRAPIVCPFSTSHAIARAASGSWPRCWWLARVRPVVHAAVLAAPLGRAYHTVTASLLSCEGRSGAGHNSHRSCGHGHHPHSEHSHGSITAPAVRDRYHLTRRLANGIRAQQTHTNPMALKS